jgi:hypothetical protein
MEDRREKGEKHIAIIEREKKGRTLDIANNPPFPEKKMCPHIDTSSTKGSFSR